MDSRGDDGDSYSYVVHTMWATVGRPRSRREAVVPCNRGAMTDDRPKADSTGPSQSGPPPQPFPVSDATQIPFGSDLDSAEFPPAFDEATPKSLGDLIDQYLPELKPQSARVGVYPAMAIVGLVIGGLVAPVFFPPGTLTDPANWKLWLGLTVASALLGLGLGEVVTRAIDSRQLVRYRRRLASSPTEAFEELGRNFRASIQHHRERVLGPSSEWGLARQPLRAAVAEANRQVAYWRARLDPRGGASHAAEQLSVAKRLSQKFQTALGELDARSDALLAFFNECEARLAALDRRGRDYEESQRLSSLSDEAERLVGNAEGALRLVARQFATEAARVGEAVGGLERLHLTSAAGALPLDRIEMVADRIIESSATDQEALSRLASRLA